jgi:hypothetical protein
VEPVSGYLNVLTAVPPPLFSFFFLSLAVGRVTPTATASPLQMRRKHMMMPQWKIDQRFPFRLRALANKMLQQSEELVAILFVSLLTFCCITFS